ncbi:alpha/beta fold hydrolase [Streptomyces virginiae]|uniref:alpha/beta fold hydrolase n=1 Tax=Streptomyces virginiae TaxID=1961 RepID=UPI00365F831D
MWAEPERGAPAPTPRAGRRGPGPYDRTGSGPALVLVHGTGSGGSAVNWGQVLPRFTADRTVITPDLSGTQRTVDDGAPLTVEGLAAQVIAVPVENSRALHAAIAGSRYAEIDAGHVAFFEKEDEFVRLVEEFVPAV